MGRMRRRKTSWAPGERLGSWKRRLCPGQQSHCPRTARFFQHRTVLTRSPLFASKCLLASTQLKHKRTYVAAGAQPGKKTTYEDLPVSVFASPLSACGVESKSRLRLCDLVGSKTSGVRCLGKGAKLPSSDYDPWRVDLVVVAGEMMRVEVLWG